MRGGPGALCSTPIDCAHPLMCQQDEYTSTCTYPCVTDMDCLFGCCRRTSRGQFCSIERCGRMEASR